MVGSGAVATFIAHVAFWALLTIGVTFGEISGRGLCILLLFWMCGVFALPQLSPTAGLLVTPYVAVLDIALAFVVFKGDVRLS